MEKNKSKSMKNVLYMHFHYLKNSYRTMYVKQENQLQNRNRKRNENTETKKKTKRNKTLIEIIH